MFRFVSDIIHYIGMGWETIFTCLYPYTVQTRLSRDQRPTKPVSHLGTGHYIYFFCILYITIFSYFAVGITRGCNERIGYCLYGNKAAHYDDQSGWRWGATAVARRKDHCSFVSHIVAMLFCTSQWFCSVRYSRVSGFHVLSGANSRRAKHFTLYRFRCGLAPRGGPGMVYSSWLYCEASSMCIHHISILCALYSAVWMCYYITRFISLQRTWNWEG